MIIDDHYLSTAIRLDSPNCNDRPDAEDISLLVIHCISLPADQFQGNYIDQLFTNQLNPGDHPSFQGIYQLKVSAHLLIRRDGELRQYVAFNRRAWHAGVSNYKGRERCNDFSIGIELEGSVNQAYEAIQYQQLAAVIKTLLAHYPHLSRQCIVGHSDIAPGRKTDPGPYFDWSRLSDLLDQASEV